MHYIDFHTHLDWYKPEDNLFSQLKNFNGTIIAASVDAHSYDVNCTILQKAKALGFSVQIIPTVGIHPEKAAEALEDLSGYDKLCDESPLIGEIGMDFCWYKDASPARQEQVFRYFLQHCHDKEKYCVIHTKDAEAQIARILEEYPKAKPIIHWYDGPEDVFQEFCRRGYMETFGCETKRSAHIQKLLRQTPYHLILAETDNPTGEPWLGGTDNSVHLIKQVYNDIAQVLGISEKELNLLIESNVNIIKNNLIME